MMNDSFDPSWKLVGKQNPMEDHKLNTSQHCSCHSKGLGCGCNTQQDPSVETKICES